MMPAARPRLQKLEEIARYAFACPFVTLWKFLQLLKTEPRVNKSFLCRVRAALEGILLAAPVYRGQITRSSGTVCSLIRFSYAGAPLLHASFRPRLKLSLY
jgi:hypothetical protein